MPELPEVEVIKRFLNKTLPSELVLTQVKAFRKDLRYPIPVLQIRRFLKASLKEKKLKYMSRRGKALVFNFLNWKLISHLGMSGEWRLINTSLQEWMDQAPNQKRKHDHFAIEFNQNLCLIYCDPRRFGYLSFIRQQDFKDYFANYGIEPLEDNLILETQLYQKIFNSKSPIKSLLMNQEYIVGVGNIYASEALFESKIHPLRLGHRIRVNEFKKLLFCVRQILNQAIVKGGSTIKSYRNANSESGQFQLSHKVYQREGQICLICGKASIQKISITGRSTFFCNTCQT